MPNKEKSILQPKNDVVFPLIIALKSSLPFLSPAYFLFSFLSLRVYSYVSTPSVSAYALAAFNISNALINVSLSYISQPFLGTLKLLFCIHKLLLLL